MTVPTLTTPVFDQTPLGCVCLWRNARAAGYGPEGFEGEAPFAIIQFGPEAKPYACDRGDYENLAEEFYDVAWRLGVPSEARTEFIIDCGSTLRNVGRTDEAESLHSPNCWKSLSHCTMSDALRNEKPRAELLGTGS